MSSNRFSAYTSTSMGSGGGTSSPPLDRENDSQTKNSNPKSDKDNDMWSSMLDSVASSKRLPEKSMLVLGGTPDSQLDLLTSLTDGRSSASPFSPTPSKAPVANSFALGYSYYDVLDSDQDDTLARVSLYMLSTPSPSFAKLLRPLFTPQNIPHSLVVILLDWATPWLWMRQLRMWMLLLRQVIGSLSLECKDKLQAAMEGWRDRGRTGGGVNLDGSSAAAVAGVGGTGGMVHMKTHNT